MSMDGAGKQLAGRSTVGRASPPEDRENSFSAGEFCGRLSWLLVRSARHERVMQRAKMRQSGRSAGS